MRAHPWSRCWSKFTVLVAALSIAALVAPPVAPAAPPPAPTAAPAVLARPGLGALPLAFLRNQGQYCSVICPFLVQGAVTVPIGAVLSPAAFLGALGDTGSLTRSLGAAAASITGPANAAFTPIIDNDLVLVLPKAQNALQVAVVETFNIGAAVLQSGGLVPAVQAARAQILAALDQPIGVPVGPTGARTIFQVVAVEGINVASAVLFQAGELLLLGVVQTVDAAAQELEASGNPVAAAAAGATTAVSSVRIATDRVVGAVNTAVSNVGAALRDPFPTAPISTMSTSTEQTSTVPRSTVSRSTVPQATSQAPRALPSRKRAIAVADTEDTEDTKDTKDTKDAQVTHRRSGPAARPQRVSRPEEVRKDHIDEHSAPAISAAPEVRPDTVPARVPGHAAASVDSAGQ